MWTLECEGPLFHNKKLWLRPGTSHLFGRTKQETLRNTESYVLDAKSVSKKHLKLSVSAVKAGNGSQLHTRSEIIIEEFSKLGTTIDGERTSQTTKVLSGDTHVLKVARYEHALILKWRPFVFTIVNLSKAEKQSKDPLSAYRAQLEPLDIKFTKEYVPGQTTHVVALKRNIAPALEALLQARHVVTKEYVDAVVKAATEEPSPSSEGEPKAPLEKDFEKNWPDAMNFVPAVANEPVPRDASYLAPDPKRADLFYGYVFVFCMKPQFDSLQPVINAGSGKAILYESFEEGKSDPQDFVRFVKNVAREKGVDELQDSTQGKGVVVVRITTKGEDWGARFVQESDRALDQRSVEQNELLDVILTLNTTGLRQKLAEEIDLTSSSRHGAPRSTRPTAASRPAPTSSAPPKSEPSTQVTRRAKSEGRFKGFFDDDDDDEDEELPPAVAPSAVTRSLPQIREDLSMDDVEDLPASAPSRATRLQPQSNARKRPTPDLDTGDIMDELLPATAAMKRRRLNQPESARPKTPESEKKPVKKPKREIDYLAEAQKRRQEADARAREDAENLKAAMDGMDIHGPANLVEIEEMQLSRSHSASVSRTSAATSARWDERWNDRPNFKRFRRKGEAQPARPRQKNFVHMEETKRRDFGVGEEYWLENSSKGRQRSQGESQAQTQTQTQALRENVAKDEQIDEEDNTQFRRRPRATRPSQAVAEEDDVEIVEETLRTGGSASQSVAGATQTTTAASTRKRAAKEPPAREPPAKKKVTQSWKQKALSEDEDEDDELAFPKRRTTRRR